MKVTVERAALLKSLGVEAVSIRQPGKLIVATVDPAKLLDLAKLNAVRYISPSS